MRDRGKLEGRPVFVVDGCRTPFIKARTGPGPFRASDLAVLGGQPLLARQPFAPSALDEVVLGCIAPGADEVNIARVVALRLGCGPRVPAWTVQRNCASGLQAIDAAALAIAAGRADLVLAGGTEAMSHAPVLWSREMVGWLGALRAAHGPLARLRAAARLRPRHLKPVIGLLQGLTDPVCGLSMGQTAEVLAARFGISREAMDAYAVESHQRLAAAASAGRLQEIVPVVAPDGRCFTADDGLRPASSVEKLARLPPVFDREFGTVTAGNSAQITDGAAWVLLASEAAIAAHGLRARARLLDCEWAALDPREMGLGPVHAAAPLLARHALALDDLDAVEINEAFAAQVLACLAAFADEACCREVLGLERALGVLDRTRLNVDGGAIALGHPVGTSGARLVLHLVEVLHARDARLGLAAICIGGGQGGAMLVERAA